MTSPQAGRERTRAAITDLDHPNSSFDFAPFIHRDAGPPVLHLIWAPHLATLDEPGPQVTSALAAARVSVDAHPQSRSIWMDPMDWTEASLPRGVPWTAYPVLGNPRYRIKRDVPIQALRFTDSHHRKAAPYSQLELSLLCELVVIHLPPDLDSDGFDRRTPAFDWLAVAKAAAKSLGPHARHVFVRKDGSPANIDADALIEGHAPWVRFHYSYAANFVAIAAKSLERRLGTPDPEALSFIGGPHRGIYPSPRTSEGTLSMVRARRGLELVSNPVALQVLYDLRRRGGAEIPDLPTDHLRWVPGLYGWTASAALTGTGRYPPRPLVRKDAHAVAEGIAGLLLLRRDGDMLRLSRTGEGFLDDLHPDCQDPDMPLRWARHPLTDSDARAMDAWIGRTFRKMKARINELA